MRKVVRGSPSSRYALLAAAWSVAAWRTSFPFDVRGRASSSRITRGSL